MRNQQVEVQVFLSEIIRSIRNRNRGSNKMSLRIRYSNRNPIQIPKEFPSATLLSSLVNIPKLKNNVASLPLNAS